MMNDILSQLGDQTDDILHLLIKKGEVSKVLSVSLTDLDIKNPEVYELFMKDLSNTLYRGIYGVDPTLMQMRLNGEIPDDDWERMTQHIKK